MKRVVVLGGCGAVGSVAVKALAEAGSFDSIVIGDVNEQRARELIGEIGRSGIYFHPFDAEDAASVRAVIEDADIVLNCVGPFYKTVKTILGAVLDAGIHYVDVCDDVDVTLEILEWDDRAKSAGVTALIGMGASPGATNLLAKLACDAFLDTTDSIDVFHTHGGEPIEGPGVVGHRLHCMSIDIPMFLDGELRYVRFFEESGAALRQTFDFPKIGENIPIFPYPHPEQVTLPRFLNVRNVTNKGSVLPLPYFDLTAAVCRLGMTSRKPVFVNGHPVIPHDFAVAYLIRERERILSDTNFGGQRGCLSVVVAGTKNGKPEEYRIHLLSTRRALGEGTGTPAAMGVLLLQQGKITARGVLPPEGCVDPMDFIGLWRSMESRREKAGGDSEETIIAQRIDADGNVSPISF